LSGAVAQDPPRGGEAEVRHVVELDMSLGAPQQLVQLPWSDDLAGATREQPPHLERLRRKGNAQTAPRQLGCRSVEVEHGESEHRYGSQTR
jgi:hypothetical protein